MDKRVRQGQKLWQKARRVIPGGNGLVSKRPHRYAPLFWPVYYKKAQGTRLWDLDGNVWTDMAQMGIGTAILGYANTEVDRRVAEAIRCGVNTTLNAPEEVELAELLLKLNPFAGGVRFTRGGGEAMSLAVRIARAYSGRDRVAFSGYHGWADWYLAANIDDPSNLNTHLMPQLPSRGVPAGLKKTAIPFVYNDVPSFKKVLNLYPDIGTVILEGARYDWPNKLFLKSVEKICRQKNIVFVMDEITSGWRATDGGIYKIFGLNPDIVVYGKAMGNGYAIAAVVGRKNVMAAANRTFASSTFWTERVGFAAALATIGILRRRQVWKYLDKIGGTIKDGWERLAEKHGLKIHVTNFHPLITMKFDYGKENLAAETFFTQEMLKRGYLAATSVYVSWAHTAEIVRNYLKAVDVVFKILSQALNTEQVRKKIVTRVKSMSLDG